jgi:hypothetical protein
LVGLWSKLPWWLRAGAASVVVAALWVAIAFNFCGMEGPVCNDARMIYRGVNAPCAAAIRPIIRAVGEKMGLSRYEPGPPGKEAFLAAIVLSGEAAYWFLLGVIASAIFRNLRGKFVTARHNG